MKLRQFIDESGFLTEEGKKRLASLRGEVREFLDEVEPTETQFLLVGSVLSKVIGDIISNYHDMNNTNKDGPRTSEARPSARRHHCTACGISHSGASSCDAANACSTCAGDGKVIPFRSVEDYPETEANPCPRCEGTGLTERYRRWRAGERMNEAELCACPYGSPCALHPRTTEALPNDLLSKAKRYLNRWFNDDGSPFKTEWKDHDAEVQDLVDMLRPAQAPKDK